jgi:acyl-coenzyme A synthetase/AMP-(fatty) acid ligase
VGEIRIRTPAAASGYFRDEVATRETFVDGEIVTHDIGFLADGELHVVGRTDDVIKVGARKVWATEVEARVAADPAVRQGGCALVDTGAGGRQRLTIVAEPRDLDDYGAVARRLARSARTAAGISVHECIFIERGSMPKTPSGKLQRHRVRHMLEGDPENVLRRVALREP